MSDEYPANILEGKAKSSFFFQECQEQIVEMAVADHSSYGSSCEYECYEKHVVKAWIVRHSNNENFPVNRLNEYIRALIPFMAVI